MHVHEVGNVYVNVSIASAFHESGECSVQLRPGPSDLTVSRHDLREYVHACLKFACMRVGMSLVCVTSHA